MGNWNVSTRAARWVAVIALPVLLIGAAAVTIAHAPPALAASKLDYVSETASTTAIYGGGQSDVHLACPAGETAIGGGARTTTPDLDVTVSEPTIDNGDNGIYDQTAGVSSTAWTGWYVHVSGSQPVARTWTDYLVCEPAGSPLGAVTSVIGQDQGGGNSSLRANTTCPQGMVAIGGGFAEEQGNAGVTTNLGDTPLIAGNSFTGPSGTYPTPTEYSLFAYDNNANDPTVITIRGVVFCVNPPTVGHLFSVVQLTFTNEPADGTSATTADAVCPAGSQVIGGGVDGGEYDNINTLEQSPYDFNGTGFEVRVNRVATVNSPVDVAAICYDPVSFVLRLAGSSRIMTAVRVSQDEYPTGGTATGAVIATGYGSFADALAGVPLAHKIGGPLLLTTSSSLDPDAQAELQRAVAPGSTVYVLGGPAALDPSIDATITSMGYKVVRLAGSDRFGTAYAIATVGLGSPSTVFEATGLDFPDALAAGAAAAKLGGAVLLTNGTSQSSEDASYFSDNPGATRYAVGGEAVTADPSATPLAGADRFATAVDVAQQFFTAPAMIGVASGLNFPDAMSGGVDAALHGGPMLLTVGSGPLPSSTDSYIESIAGGLTSANLYGGTATVGDDVVSELDSAAGQSPPADPASTQTSSTSSTTSTTSTSTTEAPTTTTFPPHGGGI